MKRIDHIGVVVDDLASAKVFMADVLGFELEREVDVPHMSLKASFYRCGDVSFELIEISDPELRKERLGEGKQARIEHIAFEVDDMANAMADLARHGVKFDRPEPRVADTPIGRRTNIWTLPETSDGVRYQLVKKG